MTKFENYFKQMRVPFKIYANFECNLRGVECCEGSYTKKTSRSHSLQFFMKLFMPITVYRSENATYEFIKAILKGV